MMLPSLNTTGPAAAAAAAAAGSQGGGGGASHLMGEELPNCGVKEDCGVGGFSVQMYTGTDNRDFPKICVGGK